MLRAALRNFLVQALSLGLNFFDRIFVVALLIRGLGVERYADWVALSSAAGLLGLAETGTNLYFGNELFRAFVADDEDRFRRMLRVGFACAGALTLFLAVIAVLVVAPFDAAGRLSLASTGLPEARRALGLMCFVTISRILRGNYGLIYRGRRKFARGSMLELIGNASLTFSALVVVLAGGGVFWLAVGSVAADLLAGWLPLIVDVIRQFPSYSRRPLRPTADEIAQALGRIKWTTLSQAGVNAMLWAPPLLLGAAHAGPTAVVSFVLARTVVNVVRQGVTMLLTSVNVELSAFADGAHRESATANLAVLANFTLAATAAMAAASVAFGAEGVSYWTGRAVLFDPTILLWLFAGALGGGLSAPLQIMLSYANEPKLTALAAVVNVGAGLGLATIGANFWGLAGMAAGLAVGELASSAFVLASRSIAGLKFDAGAYLTRALTHAAFSGLWTSGVAAATYAIPVPAGGVGFLLRLALFGIFGALPALALAAPPRLRRRLFDRLATPKRI